HGGQAQLEGAQEVGRDAEQDQGLQHVDQVARDPGVALHHGSSAVQRAEEDGGEDDPGGRTQAEQGDRDGVEPGGVGEVLGGQVVVDRGDLDGSRQAGEGTRGQQGDDDGGGSAHGG